MSFKSPLRTLFPGLRAFYEAAWGSVPDRANLFNLTFESGSLTGTDDSFDSVADPDVNEITVSAVAAMGGTTLGVRVDIDDQDNVYGRKNLSVPTSGIFRTRFYFDPNGITVGATEQFAIYNLLGASFSPFFIRLYNPAASYRLLVFVYNDAGFVESHSINITDFSHYIEVQVIRASSAVASDGSVISWVDGIQGGSTIGIDNFDIFGSISNIRVGAQSGVDPGTTGIIYIDEIAANDLGIEIGP